MTAGSATAGSATAGPATDHPPVDGGSAERLRRAAAVRSGWPYRLTFSALVAGSMSLIIGLVLSLVTAGLDGWFGAFASAAPVAFAVAFPVSLFVVPVVQRAASRLFGIEAP